MSDYITEKLVKPFKATHIVVMNYRDRWSELPEDEFDAKTGDKIELLYNPGIGSITYRREDNSLLHMSGFSGNYVHRI